MTKQNDELKGYCLFKVRFMGRIVGIIKGVKGCRKQTVVKNVLKKAGFKSVEEYLSAFPGNLKFDSDMFQISFNDQTKTKFQYGCECDSYKAYYKVNDVFDYYGAFYKSSIRQLFRDKNIGMGMVFPTIQDVKDVLGDLLYDNPMKDMGDCYYDKRKGDPDQLDDSRYKNVQFYMCEDWTEDWVDDVSVGCRRSKRSIVDDICAIANAHGYKINL